MGELWVPFKKPHFATVMKYAKSSNARQKLYVGNDNRCLDNVPRLKGIVLLRDEAARLLGYKNHAEYQIEVKMVTSKNFVSDFLEDLRDKLIPVVLMGSLGRPRPCTYTHLLRNVPMLELLIKK